METQITQIPLLQKSKGMKAQPVKTETSCCSQPSNGTSCCTPAKSEEESKGACCAQPDDGSACCS